MTKAAPFSGGAPLTQEQQALVMGALPLIESVAEWTAQRWPSFISLVDLQAAGREALVEAAQTYDPSRGAAFTTYATWRLRGAMLDAVRAEMRQRGPFLEAGAARTAADYLAERPDLPPEGLAEVDPRWRQESAAFSGELAAAVVTTMAADVLNSQDGSEEAIARRQAYGRVIDAIQHVRAEMVPREREVLDLHYGQEVDLGEVAERLSVAYSTVKRIHASMLESLAKKLQRLGIRSLDDAGIAG